MNITIAAVGSRGDVQPYAALGIGLKKAGHNVQLIADSAFEDFIKDTGLAFSPISVNPRKIFEEEISKMGKNFIRFAKWLKEQNQIFARQNFYELLNAIEKVDAIIFSPLASAAYHVAEFKKVPCIGAYLQPLSPTKNFAPTNLPELPSWFPFRKKINWSMFRFNSKVYFYMVKDVLNQCRQEVLNFPALPWKTYANVDISDNLMLYGFSKHVIPKPSDWMDNVHVTGYWFLNSADWKPPEDLVNFINAGSPPVYVGFGSMIDKKIITVTEIVIEALKKSGQRGILASGWNKLNSMEFPENIFLIKEAPHDWLFPQMAAVVHHGGAGTTAACFKAGIPSVVIPFSFDQPFWGRKVFELGVGPKAIPRKKMTIDNLAKAISSAVNTKEYNDNAKILSGKIKTEDGITEAVKIIEKFLTKK